MAVAGFRTAEQTVDARGFECALLLVVVSHPLAAAGLANSLGRMTLYPPRSFTSTNVHCDLVFCYNNQMLQVLKRCCCVNNKKKRSPPRGWPCCEPLRRLVSLSGATSLYVTLWTVSEMPDQSIKRAFGEEGKWLSVRLHNRFSLCLTLKRCYCATALLWHFYSGLATVSPAPKRCYYRCRGYSPQIAAHGDKGVRRKRQCAVSQQFST